MAYARSVKTADLGTAQPWTISRGAADRPGPPPRTGCEPAAEAERPAGLPVGQPVTTDDADPVEVDRWLARAAADRDEGAFEQLVRRHTSALYHGALRTTGSAQLAEEVVQDAWMSAWLHLGGFREQSAVRTWLVRIVTTKALNALRRPSRTVALDAVPEALLTADDGPERQAELRERAAAVRLAVASLPPRQRQAVVLRDLEGLSYEEVAQVLDCSVASVKSALHRGRGALAESLTQYGPEAARPSALIDRADVRAAAGSARRAQTGQHHDGAAP